MVRLRTGRRCGKGRNFRGSIFGSRRSGPGYVRLSNHQKWPGPATDHPGHQVLQGRRLEQVTVEVQRELRQTSTSTCGELASTTIWSGAYVHPALACPVQ